MTKLTKEGKVAMATKVVGKLDELVAKRKVWQVEFDRTNKGLYKLLAGCLESYYEIKGTTAEKEILDAIKLALKARKVKIQESTPVLTLLVRYVFNTDRRRAHGYGRALRVAVGEKITVADFANWVTKFGGVEEVARTQGATAETIKKREQLEAKVDEVKGLLANAVDTPLATVAKTFLVNAADTAEYTLLIGKTQANGKTKVLSVVPNSTSAMIEAAMKKIAQALIDAGDHIAKEQLAQAVEDAKAEAANDAKMFEVA
jgi:hypothetical protein